MTLHTFPSCGLLRTRGSEFLAMKNIVVLFKYRKVQKAAIVETVTGVVQGESVFDISKFIVCAEGAL